MNKKIIKDDNIGDEDESQNESSLNEFFETFQKQLFTKAAEEIKQIFLGYS